MSWYVYNGPVEPRHENKPCFCISGNKSAAPFFANKDSSVIQNFKPSSVVVSVLVGTPVDRFSHDAAELFTSCEPHLLIFPQSLGAGESVQSKHVIATENINPTVLVVVFV